MTVNAATYDREAVRAELMNAVDSVRDVIADCADEAERTGFYPERAWTAMHESGLFRMKAARDLGGLEADPVTQCEIFEEVARIDGAAGWTLFVGAGSAAVTSGWLQEQALGEFMIDGRLPRVAVGVVPSGKATPTDGGFRVTGQWGFGSGSAHAEWFAANAVIEGDHTPPVLGFLLPAEDSSFTTTGGRPRYEELEAKTSRSPICSFPMSTPSTSSDRLSVAVRYSGFRSQVSLRWSTAGSPWAWLSERWTR